MDNIGSDKKQRSAMDELLDRLDSLVGQSQGNTSAYRNVLRNLDQSYMSWEEPQDDCESPTAAPDSHLSKLTYLVDTLQGTINRDGEILENLNKLV